MPDDDSRPLAVVDIDGVLADVRHRLHHLERRPKDWNGFFRAAPRDAVHPEGRAVLARLAQDHDVVLLTGRPERWRRDTEDWLARHDLPYDLLVMRPDGRFRPAAEVKVGLLELLAADRPVAVVVDDDEAVIAAMAAKGWPTLHATWEGRSATLREAQERDGRT